MARLTFLVALFALLFTLVAAKPRGFTRNLNVTAPLGTRTESAVQARQLTRERFVTRSDKITMQNLFGRADCAVPEPSTGLCTCGTDWHLCNSGSICRDFQNDPLHCNSCNGVCGGTNPGCCGGACRDLNQHLLNCGACGNACDGPAGELCCSGSCADVSRNPENCGSCGHTCDIAGGEGCCNGACLNLDTDDNNCGACGTACEPGFTCCGGACVNLDISILNCGICGNLCTVGVETCLGGICVDL